LCRDLSAHASALLYRQGRTVDLLALGNLHRICVGQRV
jgi:hypothetical protein